MYYHCEQYVKVEYLHKQHKQKQFIHIYAQQ